MMLICITPAMVARKPGHQGEREGNRKTIAQGMPVDPGGPVVTTRCIFLHHTRLGCIGHPAFPAPSISGRKLNCKTRAMRRENAEPRFLFKESE